MKINTSVHEFILISHKEKNICFFCSLQNSLIMAGLKQCKMDALRNTVMH